MTAKTRSPRQPDDARLLAFYRSIASQDEEAASATLESAPGLATRAIQVAADRQHAENYFLDAIRHYVYAGDTALHIAAAAAQPALARALVKQGADVRARNRRGAEPLHYAADGNVDPKAQSKVIEFLVASGADPNAFDKSAVAPLHRAVRTRSSAAVRALLDNGAELRLGNKSGSTPLHLAVQNTGSSNSGSVTAKSEQRKIIALLLEHGAGPADTDAKGKTVQAAATSDWVRELLNTG